MRTIVFANQKGGVGKTSLSINLAGGLARSGQPDRYRILYVDTDPQASASILFLGMGFFQDKQAIGLADVLTGDVPLQEALFEYELMGRNGVEGHIDILPATRRLREVDRMLIQATNGEFALRQMLEQVDLDYDYCIIDTPPGISGQMLANGLAAADDVIIPTLLGSTELYGLINIRDTIMEMRRRVRGLRILGVVPTRTRKNTVLSAQGLATIEELFGGSVEYIFSAIPLREDYKKATARGQDIFTYAALNRLRTDSLECMGEFVREVLSV